MICKKFRITSELGIHARPATSLVNLCLQFESQILLTVFKKTVNFKSIMGVMSLGIYSGAVITITAEGSDEQEAITAIGEKIIELNLGKEI